MVCMMKIRRLLPQIFSPMATAVALPRSQGMFKFWTKTWCTISGWFVDVDGLIWKPCLLMFIMFCIHLKWYVPGGLKPPTRVDCDCLGYNMWWGRIRKNQSDKCLHAASILNVKAPMPLNTTCWNWLQVIPQWRTIIIIIPNSWFIVVCVCVCTSTWEYDIYYQITIAPKMLVIGDGLE